jgi:uncharacterized protein (TIGR03905 family)
VDVIDGRVHNLAYTGGCSGNLRAMSALAEGMEVEALLTKLSGIACGTKPTSCGDQLASLLRTALQKETEAL